MRRWDYRDVLLRDPGVVGAVRQFARITCPTRPGRRHPFFEVPLVGASPIAAAELALRGCDP